MGTEPHRAYWALWRDGEAYRIALLPMCTVERGDVDISGASIGCCLYGGHDGAHRWAT